MKYTLLVAALLVGMLTACGQRTNESSSANAAASPQTTASAMTPAASMNAMSPSPMNAMSSMDAAAAPSPSEGKNSDGYTVIDAETAKSMIDAGGVTIVDVRTASEYADKHIPDAINIPNESIGSEQPAELADLNAVILVYCRTGIRAAEASAKLAKIGYTNIYDMGGITTWPYDTVTG